MQAAGAVAAAVVSSDEADVIMRAPAGPGSASSASVAIPALLLPRSAGAALKAAAEAARTAGAPLRAAVLGSASAEQAAMGADGVTGGGEGWGGPLQARVPCGRGRTGVAGKEGDSSSGCLPRVSECAQAERRREGGEAAADPEGGAPTCEQRAGSEPDTDAEHAERACALGPEAAATDAAGPGSPPAVPAAQESAPSSAELPGSSALARGVEVELLLPPQTQAWLQAALGTPEQVGEALGALLEALSGAAMQAALVARQARQAQHDTASADAAGVSAGCASAGDA